MYFKDKQQAEFIKPIKSNSRLWLACFLSLLVWPGSGSFLINRSRDGVIQVVLGFVSFVLFMFGFAVLVVWGTPLIVEGGLGVSQFSLEGLASGLSEEYEENPPTLLGFPVFGVIVISFLVFVISWVYSLISIVLAKQSVKKGG